MADPMRETCGFCGKTFFVKPEQVGREVQCPHCKTKVKIPLPPTRAALEAAQALGDTSRRRPSARPRLHAPMPRGGVRSKSLAIVWAVVLAVAAIGMTIGLALAYRPSPTSTAPAAPGTRSPGGSAPETQEELDRRRSPAPATAEYGPPPTRVVHAPEPMPEESVRRPAPNVAEDGTVRVRVGKLLHGYDGGATSYVAGTVSNQSGEEVRGIQITVAIADSQGNPLGEAYALVRRLGPGRTAPFVATWEHAPEIRGTSYVPNYEINPALAAGRDAEVKLTAAPWPVKDSGGVNNTTGDIVLSVQNTGSVPVARLDVMAVLYDAEGGVLSAVRESVDDLIMPNQEKEVRVRYERAVSSRLQGVDALVQGIAQP